MRLHNTQTFNILSKAVFCAAKGGLFMMPGISSIYKKFDRYRYIFTEKILIMFQKMCLEDILKKQHKFCR